MIWKNFSWLWFTVDAPAGIPWVITLNIFDTMNEVSSSIGLTLSQILRYTEKIMGNCSMILNGLLYDCCFWELVLISLSMESHSSTIFNSLLTISENVGIWVEFPFIISVFLFSWLKVTMGLFVHFLNSLIIIHNCTSHWVNHILSTFKTS